MAQTAETQVTIDDVLLGLAMAIHSMGEAIVVLQERQARARNDAEKRDILLALPLLKSDQRDAEVRMAALAASRTTFLPPDAATLESLRKATEKLDSEIASARSASAVASAATALLAAVRGAAPGGSAGGGSLRS